VPLYDLEVRMKLTPKSPVNISKQARRQTLVMSWRSTKILGPLSAQGPFRERKVRNSAQPPPGNRVVEQMPRSRQHEL